MFRRRHFFILPILFLLYCSKGQQDFPGAGISRELADVRKKTVSEVSYNLYFDVPESSQESIRGELILRFKIQPGQPLILDFDSANGKVIAVRNNESGEEIPYTLPNGHIVIAPNHLDSENLIHIEFIAGNEALNRKPDYLYSLFVPARASQCFPVFDQPDLKAKYSLRLRVPSHWKAISNGAIASSQESNGKLLIEFSETKTISSYLFAFATGEFSEITREIGERKFTMLHRETDKDKVERNLDAIFDWHVKSLDWLEAYTGIEYPFQKFGFVLIPSFQFAGMEHPGAIYYKASSLLLERSHSVQQEKSRALLIAHETAHMWFGDLVTMEWFDDVWLKEVFANFMGAKITQPGFPAIDHDLQFLMSHYPAAYDVDRTKGSHPIQQPLENLKDAGSLYGSIIYQKAPIVMRMLEDNMGSENFQSGIQEYLQKHRFGNATWDQLIDILKGHTDYQISTWNDQWVKSSEMPSLSYQLKLEGDSVAQYSLFTIRREDAQPKWWGQKLKTEMGWADSTVSFQVDKVSKVVDVEDCKGLPAPDYIFNNAGGLGYGYFVMKDSSLNYYLRTIDDQTSALKRGALWINFHEHAVRGSLDPYRLVKVQITSLGKEEEPLIVSYILRSLKELYWVYLNADQRSGLSGQLEGVLLNNLLKAQQSLKTVYFEALKNVVASPKGVELLHSIYTGKTEIDGFTLSEKDLISLVYELVVRAPEQNVPLMEQQWERIENPDMKERMAFVMHALYPEPDKRVDFFESLSDPINRENEEWVLEALTYLHHPLRVHETVALIKPSLELLEDIKATGDIFFPQRWLTSTLQFHNTEEALDVVRQFLSTNNQYPTDLRNKILQSSDHLFRSELVRNKWEKRGQNEVKEAG